MKNLDKFLSLLGEKADGLLLTSRYSRHYVSEFNIAEGIAVVSAKGCRYFTDSRYIEAAQNGIKNFEVIMTDRQHPYNQLLNEAIADFSTTKGWVQTDGKWYYDDYADDWYKIGETWYMFNADGTLKVSEWFKVDGKWYWSNSNGGMVVGWAKVDGKWYFFDQGNAMKTGWVKSNGLWYYLTESGAMATNTTIDGYKIDANGVWVA